MQHSPTPPPQSIAFFCTASPQGSPSTGCESGLAVQKHTLVSRVSLLARLFFTTTFLQGFTLVARVHPCCKGPPLLQGFMISNDIPDWCFHTLVSRVRLLARLFFTTPTFLQELTLVARVHTCCKGPPLLQGFMISNDIPDCCFQTLVSRVSLLARPCFYPNLLARVHPCCKGSPLVFCTFALLARASCQLSFVPSCKGCCPYCKGWSFTCWTFSKGLWKELCWPSA